MAVVLEAPSIQPDHALDVLLWPEDVVVEEAVAIERGLLRDLGASDRTVPHERRDAVEGLGGRGVARQGRPESALPVDHVLAPESMEQVVMLDRELDGVPDVLPEPGIDRAHVAATEHQVHASAG